MTPSSFDVGNYDLANTIRIIETTSANQEIDNIYGVAITFKRPDISVLTQDPTFQKKTISGTDKEDICTDSSGTVVCDMPRTNSTNAMQIDLKNQTIKRNRLMSQDASNPFVYNDERTATVFSTTTAGSGMRVVGTRSLTFRPSLTIYNNQTVTHNITSYTTAFTEDVFYIATLDMFGEFTGAHFITEGDNLLWKVDLNNRTASQSGTFFNVRFNFQLKLYLEQLSDSRVRARMRVQSSGWTLTSNVNLSLTQISMWRCLLLLGEFMTAIPQKWLTERKLCIMSGNEPVYSNSLGTLLVPSIIEAEWDWVRPLLQSIQ